jgi:hypothetical protein
MKARLSWLSATGVEQDHSERALALPAETADDRAASKRIPHQELSKQRCNRRDRMRARLGARGALRVVAGVRKAGCAAGGANIATDGAAAPPPARSGCAAASSSLR